jgi:diguanylate cyclase (GGDEF)-like protein
MDSRNYYVWIYLLALVALASAALVLAVTGVELSHLDRGELILGPIAIIASTRLRIQLPRSTLHLALSDALILFSLLYFGGEVAVLLAAIGGAASIIFDVTRRSLIASVVNGCISVISVFVMVTGISALFGTATDILAHHAGLQFIVVVLTLTLIPLIINTLLTSAFLAIQANGRYLREIANNGPDAALVYLGTAILAALSAIAIHDGSVFMLFTVVGFFTIMQVAFGRYRVDHRNSQHFAERSVRERVRIGEKHVAELKHYIDALELSSQALKDSREKYRHAAFHDSLTGLPNRNKFLEVAEGLIQRCQYVPSDRFAIIYLDLQRFKTINDSLGHLIGDELIASVGSRLSDLVSGEQMVGRFSGDKFAILLPEIISEQQADEFADLVANSLARPFDLNGRQIFTGAAVGVAIGSSKYFNASELIRDADIAMYRAKERGRNVVRFEENMHVQAVTLLQLETDLRLAVERREFELFYQPIIDLENMDLSGVEALVRWSHPEFGQINPERFIGVAESTGLIIPMTLQIMRAACEMLKVWNTQLGKSKPLFVSINLSGAHFNHPDVVEHVRSTLAETGVDPRWIKLEITETAVMENAERASNVLKQIKMLGVQLSIDDFGTGYSSLNYLQRFPIDTLKIDRSFVRSMEDGRQNGEIVRMILALADAMKLSVVAEGIESVHQLHQLRILNCKYGQGFLFSHPLPANEIGSLLQTTSRWENLVSGASFAIVPPPVDALVESVH